MSIWDKVMLTGFAILFVLGIVMQNEVNVAGALVFIYYFLWAEARAELKRIQQ